LTTQSLSLSFSNGSLATVRRSEFPVALITMPFISYCRPSIQLGLLKAITATYGFPVTTFHLHLNFAHYIGLDLYEALCFDRGTMLGVGDWLFAKAAFGAKTPHKDDFLELKNLTEDKILKGLLGDVSKLKELRNNEIPAFINKVVEEEDWGRFKVIGFSSTFEQNAASFALAAAIKRRYPRVCILFGGANFEGEMGLELVRSVECIDYAISGEGDKALPEFFIALQERKDPAKVPGVISRKEGKVHLCPAHTPLRTLDELPTPDYSEYFERLERLGMLPTDPETKIAIPYESARGCWWGQKHQCTFCGLNGTGITYRSKSAGKVLAELEQLSTYYPKVMMEAVDNILDMDYFNSFFPQVIEKNLGYEFFYEVKANLTKDQLALLAKGGVTALQPGIESLNSHVLKLMKKGIMAIQNVNMMRWAKYYGIKVSWNILWGFPGEAEEDYYQQAALMPRLFHLYPPILCARIRMERFSPIFAEEQNFPTWFMRPDISYSHIYPEEVALEKVAYFFDYEFKEGLAPSVYEDTVQASEQWQRLWGGKVKPSLYFWVFKDFVQIEDLRNPQEPHSITLDEPQASIYRALSDQPHTALAVKTQINYKGSITKLEQILQELGEAGLVMQDGKYYLSLAIPSRKRRCIIKDERLYFSLPG
jgi:ribosomal peptide maturation radical SAM protein 1